MATREVEQIVSVLTRRLPSLATSERQRLAVAYLTGVHAHAVERTTGTGSVPTNLSSERAALTAFVCRALGRLMTEDEIAALLRVTVTAARSVQKTMLAVFDDIPLLIFKAAFADASRDGRGSEGDIRNGYRVKFSKGDRMDMARTELERRGLMCEILETTATRHVLLIDASFDIDSVLPE